MEAGPARLLRVGGGLAAALIAAFTFTNWQNSNETEVYAVATFTIAAIAWLCLRLARRRGARARAAHLLLLILYLAGLSIGNHLLALLVGPAVVAFLVGDAGMEPAAGRRPSGGRMGQAAVDRRASGRCSSAAGWAAPR